MCVIVDNLINVGGSVLPTRPVQAGGTTGSIGSSLPTAEYHV